VYTGEHGSYSGNGYVYQFRGSLSEMKNDLNQLYQFEWINEKTRAIIIQLTLYNSNTKLFTSVTFLSEFLSSTAIISTARFEPLDFYLFSSLLQLVLMIIYMGFTLYFMYIEIRLLIKLKQKYFSQFWSLIQLSIIGCSWASVAIYICRFKESIRIRKLFSKKNVYINFQLIVYINDILTYLFGFCCFFGLIKFVHLSRINHRSYLFLRTLAYAKRRFILFTMIFSLIYLSFICLFYLLFVSKIFSCSTLLHTMQMLFKIILMKFDTIELFEADAVLGPIVLTLFIFTVVFMCLNMFVAIINDSFRQAKDEKLDDDHMISYMFDRFLCWTRKVDSDMKMK